MAIPTGLPGPWVEAADVLTDAELTGVTEDFADQFAMFASEILYVLSNKQWPGVATRVVRPDLGQRRLWSQGGWMGPVGSPWTDLPWWVGEWAPTGSYGYGGFYCPDRAADRFKLPGPVQAVDGIVVDGVPLDVNAYRVVGRNQLQRVDGGRWPTGQDLTRDPTDPDSPSLENGGRSAWQVTYEWGEEPPDSGKIACTSLLRELVTAILDCEACRLPWAGAIATVQRKGTTVNYGSLHDQFEKGYVGLADVDLWLNSARGGPWRPRRPRIIRADARPRRSESTWR